MKKDLCITLRKLCLMALLCILPGNAIAYKVFEGQFIINGPEWGDNAILVVNKSFPVENIYNDGKALIIDKDATVNVLGYFANAGVIYVFGTLDISGSLDSFNGSIYVMEGGQIIGNIGRPEYIYYNCKISDVVSSHIIKGKVPTETEDGWKDFYVKDAIICEDDYFPIEDFTSYYTDETEKAPIPFLGSWQEGEGKITYLSFIKSKTIEDINNTKKELFYIERFSYDIDDNITRIMYAETIDEVNWIMNSVTDILTEWKFRSDAIKEINNAAEDVIAYYPDCLNEVDGYIQLIISAGTYDEIKTHDEIKNAKESALAIIKAMKKVYDSVIASALGSLGTKQNGPALIVTDKDDNEIILYSPKSVEYIKVNEE